VTNLVHFGAFIDLVGMEGLVHISEIAWEQVTKPANFFTVGDEIEVIIKHVDVEEEKVSLSRKELLPNPWMKFETTHAEGDLVEGVVTSVTDFGAFARVTDGIEGLIHVSEIRGPQQLNPQEVLHTGDIVLVRITSIEANRQRLGLSQRKVRQDEETAWIWEKQTAVAPAVAPAVASIEAPIEAPIEA
jgi:ribosomal protein S1